MQKTCTQCSATFEITNEDLELYDKVSPVFNEKKYAVPPPHICPEDSERLRLAFRNERKYYRRKCDATGKMLLTFYPPDSPYKVYHRDTWFSDAYDPLEYGREFDFTRPFFEQLKELSLAVPYEHMIIINSTNCDYCNFILDGKNCYLSQRVDKVEDCSYCWLVLHSRNCVDCNNILTCELCYECVDCTNCYATHWSQRCLQCSDCAFCIDCIGCRNCLGCTGLRQKEYHIFNEPCTPEEYKNKLQEYMNGSYPSIQNLQNKLKAIDQKRPQRAVITEQTENVTGDYINKSRNVHRSFHVLESEDVLDSFHVEFGKDAARCCFAYYPEKTYEFLSCAYSQNVRFSYGVYNSHDIEYCMMVHNSSHDCFGSIGLKGNAYVILNKQYSKEGYEELVPKIIEHMKSTGEYGNFFPPALAHFAYNETVAQEYYPLTKERALALGFRWRDEKRETPHVEKVIPSNKLPESIDQIPDDILNWAIVCEETAQPFKIIKQELEFYRQMKLPVPHLHPDERHNRRIALRNPRKLWDRTCDKCAKEIQTTYSPERKETVYCEDCYLATVY